MSRFRARLHASAAVVVACTAAFVLARRGAERHAPRPSSTPAASSQVASATASAVGGRLDPAAGRQGTADASDRAPGTWAFDEAHETLRFEHRNAAFAGRVDRDGTLVVEPHRGAVESFTLRLASFGRSRSMPLAAPSSVDEASCAVDESPSPEDCIARAEARRDGGLVEWFEQRAQGLEHGFTFAERPPGSGALRLSLAVGGGRLAVEDGERPANAKFVGRGTPTLAYRELAAFDATRRSLPAWFEPTERGLDIVVDDTRATYPVVVDPIIVTSYSTVAGSVGGSAPGLATPNSDRLSDAGDVNGDGFGDFVVGEPRYSNGQTNEGRVLVYTGSSTGLPATGATPFAAVEVDCAGCQFGDAVAGAGDFDGDGFGDIIVGAQLGNYGLLEEGAVFAYRGSATGLTLSVRLESDQLSAHFGASVDAAGDIDADGFTDVIIGAPDYDNGTTNEGRAYLYRGSSSGLVANSPTTVEPNSALRFGYSVSTAGDVNADGYDDVVVGMDHATGGAYVYQGSSSGLVTTAAVIPGTGGTPSSYAGRRVAGGADIGGDGYDDVVVLLPTPSGGTGSVQLYRGSSSGIVTTSTWDTLGNPAGTNSGFGDGLEVLGDINEDGYGDLAVMVDYSPPGSRATNGSIQVYYGSIAGVSTGDSVTINPPAGQFVAAISPAGDVNGDGITDVVFGNENQLAYVFLGAPAQMTGAAGATGFGGTLAYDASGTAAVVVGDLNRDGFDDIVVGSPGADGGGTNAGAIQPGMGSATGIINLGSAITVAAAGGAFGSVIAPAGDVNADGFDDVLVGVPTSNASTSGGGLAYLFRGSASGLSTTFHTQVSPGGTGWRLGSALAPAGDMNGDGFADFVVGAPGANSNRGLMYLYFGGSGSLAAPQTIDLALNGSQSGSEIDGIGDLNGDGLGDIVFSNPRSSNGQTNEGSVWIFYGDKSPTFIGGYGLESNSANTYLGTSVAGLGDMNGDGLDDFAFTDAAGNITRCLGTATQPFDFSTRCAAVTGTAVGGIFPVGDANGDGLADLISFSATSPSLLLSTGTTFATALLLETVTASYGAGTAGGRGDVNGDGYSDMVVGHPGADIGVGMTDNGRVRMYLGALSDTGQSGRLDRRVRIAQTGASVLVRHWGNTTPVGTYDVLAGPRTVFTRARVRLEVEDEARGTLFDGAGLDLGAWTDPGTGYADLRLVVPANYATDRHAQARLRIHPARARPQLFTPWVAAGIPGQTHGVHVRMPGLSNGVACTAANQCASGFCADGVCCNSACGGSSTTDCRACSVTFGAATNGTCGAVTVGFPTACRAANGTCDTAEYCDGTQLTCPTDGFRNSATVCRAANTAAGFECDVAERCTGTSAACPADGVAAAATVCRNSVGACDLPESCNGTSAACPTDLFLPGGISCRPTAGVCDVGEVCTGTSGTCPTDTFVTSGTVCNATVNGVCDAPDTCTGSSATCPATYVTDGTTCDDGKGCTGSDACQTGVCRGTRRSAGAVCRAAVSTCDVAETCSGLGDDCPGDVVATSGTVCRAAIGTCDVAEVCSGASAICPGDVVQPSGASCRPSAGVCDVGEVCNGSSGACPTDRFVTSGTNCRAASGVCDVADTCNGASAACNDAKAPNGQSCDDGAGCTGGDACNAGACVGSLLGAGAVCRAASGACDLAETCDGASTACPLDVVQATSTVCRASAGTCDIAEVCDGATKACPGDAFASSSIVCRQATGVCDATETCTGSNAACPADAFLPSSTSCGGSSGQCRTAGFCSGVDDNCASSPLPNGTACDDGSLCSSADACVAGECVGTPMPAGIPCRAASGVCDATEYCDGIGSLCPADGVQPVSTLCRAASGGCDLAESCDGSSKACPGDGVLPPGIVCRAVAGVCDVAETCDGSLAACPVDAFAPASQACDVANGACDAPDFCSGASATCPETYAPDGQSCDDGLGCTGPDRCAAGACTSSRLAAGTVCRAAAGSCDVSETCSGADDDCPTDAKRSGSVICRGSTGPCDLPESCDGVSSTCPSNGFQALGVVCRPAASVCDVPETCTGLGTTCPTDGFAAASVQCSTANGPCDLDDFCSGTDATCDQVYAADGTSCDDAADCTTSDQCQTGACRGTRLPAGTQCRAPNGACDVAEACTGASDNCPLDAVATANTVCRAANGGCDLAEVCDGASRACPGDILQAAGVTCRASVSSCDVDEACDGTSAACPTDVFAPATTACGTATSACDADDHCSGVDSTCPDTVQPDGTTCDDGGACTFGDACIAGTCNGSLAPAGVVCRASTGACDAEERCDGADTACPSDAVLPVDTVCRGTSGACDLQEVCDGSSKACPGDVVQGAGVSCRAATNVCDVDETCDGASPACPVDAFAPATTVCATANGGCDADDHCTGTDTSCPNAVAVDGTACDDGGDCSQSDVCQSGLCVGTLQPAGTVCRTASGACDIEEKCDGAGAACPADAVFPTSTECRPAAGICDVAEVCDGVQGGCPGDVLLSAGTTCRGAVANCDIAETCTGVDPTCPADVVQPDTFLCRSITDPCGTEQYCDGFAGTCPTTGAVPDGTPCDDGLACTQASSCVAGACAGTVQFVCNDNDPCTTDVCVEPAGCSFALIPACGLDAGVDAGGDGGTTVDAGGDGGNEPPLARGGCACRADGHADGGPWGAVAFALTLLGCRRVSRVRRRTTAAR